MCHVLVVEDDPSIHQLYAMALRRRGIDCTVVEDGERALAEIRRGRFDAVILDLLLPKVNGFEVLRELKCTSPATLSRVVVCSVMRRSQFSDCAELELVHAYLEKPMDIPDLLTAVLTAAGDAVQERKPARSVLRQGSGGAVVSFRRAG